MSRVIKFRAWDGTKMHTNDAPCQMCGSVNYNSDYQLMQFTGLKDCNGVEIYEGDIVKRALGNLVVVWQAPVFVMKRSKKHKAWAEFIFSPDRNQLEEVIGNLHQTPELLS